VKSPLKVLSVSNLFERAETLRKTSAMKKSKTALLKNAAMHTDSLHRHHAFFSSHLSGISDSY
jgi:hypothetical protein